MAVKQADLSKRTSANSQKPDYAGIYKYMFKMLDVVWSVMPAYLGTIIATLLIFLGGSVMRGDWLFILVHFLKAFNPSGTIVQGQQSEDPPQPVQLWSLKAWKLEGLPNILLMDLAFSYTLYFAVCGFLQWYFYVGQRNQSEQWKCQPDKFLSPEIERHEIVLGSINVGFGGLIFGTLACYVLNGGTTTLYFKPDEYGWIWFLLSIPLHFIYQDAGAYYAHRVLHVPVIYKHIHKWHHYYKQPTAFSATALHPAELLWFQVFMLLPVFTVPLNAFVYAATLIYIYYYGLISHSGIELESIWPWQPNVSYHDNHHQYFHVNFGANTTLFDRLHGTLRKKDRVYNEKIFGGKGILLQNATVAQKKEHAEELAAELSSKPKVK